MCVNNSASPLFTSFAGFPVFPDAPRSKEVASLRIKARSPYRPYRNYRCSSLAMGSPATFKIIRGHGRRSQRHARAKARRNRQQQNNGTTVFSKVLTLPEGLCPPVPPKRSIAAIILKKNILFFLIYKMFIVYFQYNKKKKIWKSTNLTLH